MTPCSPKAPLAVKRSHRLRLTHTLDWPVSNDLSINNNFFPKHILSADLSSGDTICLSEVRNGSLCIWNLHELCQFVKQWVVLRCNSPSCTHRISINSLAFIGYRRLECAHAHTHTDIYIYIYIYIYTNLHVQCLFYSFPEHNLIAFEASIGRAIKAFRYFSMN